MKIESLDFFYLKMPVIRDIGDGSQDALLVRVRSGDRCGWGECEAAPLVSIANAVCLASHSACQNVRDQVVGATIDGPDDIVNLGHLVRAKGLDIAQTSHTLSGVEIAIWDLLGKHLEEPVFRLLGYESALPKTPYASLLFGDTPEETFEGARRFRQLGYQAVKFGWGVYGRGTVQADRQQVCAAREGLGPDGVLLVDAGTVWVDDVDAAARRLDALEDCHAVWLEEPFVGPAVHAYAALAQRCRQTKLAGGEGAMDFYAARHLIDHGKIGYVQIDTGRIGGLAPAKAVADYATAAGVTYVNHTFTTQLALAASLAPFAGISSATICELPVEASPLAEALTQRPLETANGQIRLPDQPGLGVDVNPDAVRQYLVDVEIKVGGTLLYKTPVV